MPYYVYLFEGEKNRIYIGQTNDIVRRLEEHKIGKGGKYSTRKFKGILMLRHLEIYETREEAEKREKQLKEWTRKKKEALIMENEDQLKRFSKKNFNNNRKRPSKSKQNPECQSLE